MSFSKQRFNKWIKIVNSQNIRAATAGSFIIKFLSAFFTFLSGVLLARMLGVKEFGVYTVAFTTVTLLSVPASLGFPALLTRYLSKYEVENNKAAIKGILIRTNQMAYSSTLIILFFFTASYFFWWKNLDSSLVTTLWYSFILIPLIALSSLRAGALRGLRFIILGQIPDTLLRNFLLCLGISIYFFLNISLTPAIAMLIHVISAAISYFVGYLFLKSKILIDLKNVKPIFYNKEWYQQAIPFTINSGIQIVKSKLLTYILAIFGSLESVAIFDIALRGATLVSFTLDAMNSAIGSYISHAYERNDLRELQKIVTKTSRIIFASSLPIILIFVFGGKPLLGYLFGKEYDASYIPLIILCVGQLVNALTGSVVLVLAMTGNQKYFATLNVIMTCINLVLCIPFIIHFDVLGAAVLMSTINILQNILLALRVKKKLNINTTIF